MPMTKKAEKMYKPRRPEYTIDDVETEKTRELIRGAKQEQEDEAMRAKIKSMGFKKGGVTRADGCVTKGHTKGKMI